jgi:hypothetical protein
MSEFWAGVVGVAVGGGFGVLGTAVSVWGPSRVQRKAEDRRDEPRKVLLLRLLNDKDRESQTLKRLCVVTGTSEDECRRLLVQVGARGLIYTSGKEGWALISRKPLKGLYTSDAPSVD